MCIRFVRVAFWEPEGVDDRRASSGSGSGGCHDGARPVVPPEGWRHPSYPWRDRLHRGGERPAGSSFVRAPRSRISTSRRTSSPTNLSCRRMAALHAHTAGAVESRRRPFHVERCGPLRRVHAGVSGCSSCGPNLSRRPERSTPSIGRLSRGWRLERLRPGAHGRGGLARPALHDSELGRDRPRPPRRTSDVSARLAGGRSRTGAAGDGPWISTRRARRGVAVDARLPSFPGSPVIGPVEDRDAAVACHCQPGLYLFEIGSPVLGDGDTPIDEPDRAHPPPQRGARCVPIAAERRRPAPPSLTARAIQRRGLLDASPPGDDRTCVRTRLPSASVHVRRRRSGRLERSVEGARRRATSRRSERHGATSGGRTRSHPHQRGEADGVPTARG